MAETKVTILDNGPLRLEGELTLCDASGKTYGLGGRKVIALCRCGHSENKPFCDGAHGREGFASQVKAQDLPSAG